LGLFGYFNGIREHYQIDSSLSHIDPYKHVKGMQAYVKRAYIRGPGVSLGIFAAGFLGRQLES
jgi:hypothetical protein